MRYTADGVWRRFALRVVAVEIVFEFAIDFDDIARTPAFGTGFFPGLEVRGHAAQRPHAHDAGAAAHNPRLRI